MTTLINGVVTAAPVTLNGWPRTTIYIPTVNMNSVADTVFNINLTGPYKRYIIQLMWITHASTALNTATQVRYGLFTAAGGGGTTLVADSASTISTAAESTNNNIQVFSMGTTQSMTNTQLFFRVSVAHGSAATADVYLEILPIL